MQCAINKSNMLLSKSLTTKTSVIYIMNTDWSFTITIN